MGKLQPDISGYMASLGTTNKPLDMCNSCQRALIYGAVMYAGSVKAELDQANAAVRDMNPVASWKAMSAATQHAGALVEMLAEFVRADLICCLPGAEDLNPQDWKEAMGSFFEARAQLYVSPEGKIVFEPHGPDSGDPAGVTV